MPSPAAPAPDEGSQYECDAGTGATSHAQCQRNAQRGCSNASQTSICAEVIAKSTIHRATRWLY
eukprot:3065093-Pyramimonas_sp.AAC.1